MGLTSAFAQGWEGARGEADGEMRRELRRGGAD